jgi:hypothetical protein
LLRRELPGKNIGDGAVEGDTETSGVGHWGHS